MVDAAALLYLNPEVEADSNVTTTAGVLQALAADASAFAGLAATLPTTPPGFDARVYVASQPDVSGANDTIRRAMLAAGLSDAAVERRGTYVATIMEDVAPLPPQPPAALPTTFALSDPEATPFRFGPSNARPGDWLRLVVAGGVHQGDSLQARVAQVAADGLSVTLDAASISGARPALLAADASGRTAPWRAIGLRLWDCQRQALVALSRAQAAASNAVPPDDVGPRADFDLDMYHAVYPQTRHLCLADTYLDYRTRWRRNSEYRIIKGRDIFNLAAPYTSNLLGGGGGGGGGDGGGAAVPSGGGGATYYGRVTAPFALVYSNLAAGGPTPSNAFLRVSPSNLLAGPLAPAPGQPQPAPLLRVAAYGGAGGAGIVDAVSGALTVDAAAVRFAAGAVVVTASGDVVAGGAASNLAVSAASGLVSARAVSVSDALDVGGRLGIGMACTGSETAAGAADWFEAPTGAPLPLTLPPPAPLSLGPGGTRLAVAGDIFATGTVVSLSDARMKTDVRPIEEALRRVRGLGGYTFGFTGQEGQAPRRHTGLLAHEVRAALPEAVYAAPGRMASVAYGNLVGLLVEAIKELSCRVEALEATRV